MQEKIPSQASLPKPSHPRSYTKFTNRQFSSCIVSLAEVVLHAQSCVSSQLCFVVFSSAFLTRNLHIFTLSSHIFSHPPCNKCNKHFHPSAFFLRPIHSLSLSQECFNYLWGFVNTISHSQLHPFQITGYIFSNSTVVSFAQTIISHLNTE